MARSYPRYAGKIQGNPRWPPTITCEACAAPATCYADVQWSWFRGDDETYKVCDAHLQVARENINEFVDVVEDIRLQKRNKS